LKSNKNHKLFVFVFAFIFANATLWAQSTSDTTLVYPFSGSQSGGMFMHTPPNFYDQVSYDLTTNQYYIQNKIGGLNIGK